MLGQMFAGWQKREDRGVELLKKVGLDIGCIISRAHCSVGEPAARRHRPRVANAPTAGVADEKTGGSCFRNGVAVLECLPRFCTDARTRFFVCHARPVKV